MSEFTHPNFGDILKNDGNQTISVVTDLNCMDKKYNGNQMELKLFGYHHSFISG